MVSRMLTSDRIDVALGTDGLHALATIPHRRALWTGEIDAYFGQCHGPLPYRSLRFEHSRVPTPDGAFAQPVAVVNTPSSDVASTRVIEHRHFLDQRLAFSTLTTEFPQPHVPGVTTPFYPLPEERATRLFGVYAQLADREFPRVLFAGRLADYRYYDMHQAVGRALSLARGGSHLAPSQRNATWATGERTAR
jgi:UDP-galactopyranose mutase